LKTLPGHAGMVLGKAKGELEIRFATQIEHNKKNSYHYLTSKKWNKAKAGPWPDRVCDLMTTDTP